MVASAMHIRPATADDTDAIAAIDHAAKAAALGEVRWAHTPAEVRGWLEAVRLPAGGCWLAEVEAAPFGYMALRDDWVEQLYVAPRVWRSGVGTALLNHAKALHPAGLRLWCFQTNLPARAFYLKHGFRVERLTDGADNEEREPDMLFSWPEP